MARPRFRFGLACAPHKPPTSGGYRGALVRLQARDGFHTSDNKPSLACRASASITGCVRKSLLRLRPSAYLTRDHRLGLATALRLRQNACRRNTPPLPRSLEHKIQHAKCGFWYNYYELKRAHAGLHGKAQDHRMKSESKRKILVAGMGTSPAVLTNAVWALAH